MSGYSFDANIIIDALLGVTQARLEIDRARRVSRVWLSRMTWIETMSKGDSRDVRVTREFLFGFMIDEIDVEIANHAAALRRERPRLRSPDAIILASAVVRGRILGRVVN